MHAIADFLPKNIEAGILQNVVVLLVNVNISYIYGYLQPLDSHQNIYLFNQSGQRTEVVTYYVGKYGTCPAAIRKIPQGFAVYDNRNAVVMMAEQCFPNLGAIISVGAACGIKKKAQICDVLVSSKIINYDYDITMDSCVQRGEAISLSSPVIKLFTQPVQWPGDEIKRYLEVNTQQMPNVKCGVILSGSYPIADSAKQSLLSIADEIIGIEINGANLFVLNQPATVNTVIVKGVCDFGDGMHIDMHRPTAALLAADLVHKGLSHSQALEILKGLAT